MTAVISITIDPATPAEGTALIRELGRHLGTTPREGSDTSWEFAFDGSYASAHTMITQALSRIRPDWAMVVTLEYALTA